MPINQLYFVPWSSIAEDTNGTSSINTGQDIGNVAATWNFPPFFSPNTISLVGPTASIQVDDTGTSPTEFTDDFQFADQALSAAYDGNPVGSGVETLYSYTLSGSDGSTVTIYGVAIGGSATDDVLDGFVADAPLLPGVTYTVTSVSSIVDIGYSELVPCFVAGSMIETTDGPRPVETLAVGDLVLTLDHGPQPIRWCGSKTISFDKPDNLEKLRPIRIQAHAISQNIPDRDLFVSPQHRIFVQSKICQRMFCCDEVLVAAKQLCGIDGIEIDKSMDSVTYVHILCDHHEILVANGAATESLLKGPEALKAVGHEAFGEIAQLFPEICDADYQPIPARQIVRGRLARKLAMRHRKNCKKLCFGAVGPTETKKNGANWSYRTHNTASALPQVRPVGQHERNQHVSPRC